MPSLPPGPKAPRILQTIQWVRKPIPFMQECMQRYGDCFTVHWLGGPPIVFFSDPEAIKQIFASNPEQPPGGQGQLYFETHPRRELSAPARRSTPQARA